MDDGKDIYSGGNGPSGGPPPKWPGCIVLPLIGLVIAIAVERTVSILSDPQGDLYDYIMALSVLVFLAVWAVTGVIACDP